MNKILDCSSIQEYLKSHIGKKIFDVLIGPADLSFEIGKEIETENHYNRVSLLISCRWELKQDEFTWFNSETDHDDNWHLDHPWKKNVISFLEEDSIIREILLLPSNILKIIFEENRSIVITPSLLKSWTIFYSLIDTAQAYCSFYSNKKRFDD